MHGTMYTHSGAEYVIGALLFVRSENAIRENNTTGPIYCDNNTKRKSAHTFRVHSPIKINEKDKNNK